MDNIKFLFERQAKWQRTRAKLSWTEKLKLAEILRDAALAMGPNQRKSEMKTGCEANEIKEC